MNCRLSDRQRLYGGRCLALKLSSLIKRPKEKYEPNISMDIKRDEAVEVKEPAAVKTVDAEIPSSSASAKSGAVKKKPAAKKAPAKKGSADKRSSPAKKETAQKQASAKKEAVKKTSAAKKDTAGKKTSSSKKDAVAKQTESKKAPTAKKDTSKKVPSAKKETSSKQSESKKSAAKKTADPKKKDAKTSAASKKTKEPETSAGTLPPELKGFESRLKGYAERSRLSFDSETYNAVFTEYMAGVFRKLGYKMVMIRNDDNCTITMLDKDETDGPELKNKFVVRCAYKRRGCADASDVVIAQADGAVYRADQTWCLTATEFTDDAVRKSKKKDARVSLYNGKRLYREFLSKLDRN